MLSIVNDYSFCVLNNNTLHIKKTNKKTHENKPTNKFIFK